MRAIGVSACLVAVFTSGVEGEPGRQLSYDQIAGYEPSSSVVQHSLIDLDQKEMEAHLKKKDFAAAKSIYLKGGNSGAYAEITIPALTAKAAKKAKVKQGGKELGYMKEEAAVNAIKIKVSYTGVCRDGGLAVKNLVGCFNTAGPLTIGALSLGTPTAVVNKYRTLAGFSIAAKNGKNGFAGKTTYEAYKKLYSNIPDHAHQRVLAALDKTGICSACDDTQRIEMSKKTSVCLNVWGYVVREMEDAIDDCNVGCKQCNDDPGVHAWDEAWAFYAGSLEGKDGKSEGKLLYQLAEKRCANFGTCTAANGGAKVNEDLLVQFKLGLDALLNGKCTTLAPIRDRIIQLMSIPLVQGALRYAYKVTHADNTPKSVAEGAAFSSAILPRIHACDATAAKTIKDNQAIGVSPCMPAGWAAVKKAYESTYKCLGITCKDVGGVISAGTTYKTDADPCSDASTTPTDVSAGLHVQPTSALSLGALILALAASGHN